MTLEQLPPDTLTEQIQIRREQLKLLLAKKLRSLKSAPEGRLRVAQAHEGRKLQYYHVITQGDTKGSYLPPRAASACKATGAKTVRPESHKTPAPPDSCARSSSCGRCSQSPGPLRNSVPRPPPPDYPCNAAQRTIRRALAKCTMDRSSVFSRHPRFLHLT